MARRRSAPVTAQLSRAGTCERCDRGHHGESGGRKRRGLHQGSPTGATAAAHVHARFVVGPIVVRTVTVTTRLKEVLPPAARNRLGWKILHRGGVLEYAAIADVRVCRETDGRIDKYR